MSDKINSINVESRNKKDNDSKKRIIEAALISFSRKGYHGSSMREISKVAGVSLGLTYVYFKSKESLLEEMIGGHLQRLNLWAEDARLDGRFHLQGFIDFMQSERKIVLLLLSLVMQPDSVPGIGDLIQVAYKKYDKAILQIYRVNRQSSMDRRGMSKEDIRFAVMGRLVQSILPENIHRQDSLSVVTDSHDSHDERHHAVG